MIFSHVNDANYKHQNTYMYGGYGGLGGGYSGYGGLGSSYSGYGGLGSSSYGGIGSSYGSYNQSRLTPRIQCTIQRQSQTKKDKKLKMPIQTNQQILVNPKVVTNEA